MRHPDKPKPFLSYLINPPRKFRLKPVCKHCNGSKDHDDLVVWGRVTAEETDDDGKGKD